MHNTVNRQQDGTVRQHELFW